MKDPKNATITDSEWMVMRATWTMGHATSRELIDAMNELEGWSASTTKTLLHRLIQKQAVAQHGGSRPFTYKPVVGEKESMAAAADDLFDHMCAMRAGSTIAGVIQSRELSRADIANLQAILAEKAKTAPEEVQCNCCRVIKRVKTVVFCLLLGLLHKNPEPRDFHTRNLYLGF